MKITEVVFKHFSIYIFTCFAAAFYSILCLGLVNGFPEIQGLLVTFIFSSLFIIVMAFIPYIIAVFLLEKFNVTSLWSYSVFGAFCGTVCAILPMKYFHTNLMTDIMPVVVSGALAGLTYGYIVKHSKSKTSEPLESGK